MPENRVFIEEPRCAGARQGSAPLPSPAHPQSAARSASRPEGSCEQPPASATRNGFNRTCPRHRRAAARRAPPLPKARLPPLGRARYRASLLAASRRATRGLRTAEEGEAARVRAYEREERPHLLQGPHVVLPEQAADALVEAAGGSAEAVLLLGAAAPRRPSAGPRRAAQQQGEEQQHRRQPTRRHGRPRCTLRRGYSAAFRPRREVRRRPWGGARAAGAVRLHRSGFTWVLPSDRSNKSAAVRVGQRYLLLLGSET